MRNQLGPLVAMGLVAAAATGCGRSAPSRFYTLDSTATSDDMPTAACAVVVGPVSVPASVDRPEFVVQVGPNRVEPDEFNRWAAPLDDAIARAVAGDLAVLLGTPRVTTAPLANVEGAYRVVIDVQRFDSIPGKAAVVEAAWVVRAARGVTRSGRTVAHEAVSGAGFDALAAAHSRALAKLSGDIAAAIRAGTDR
ncbi:MAG TPA: PqiC family protein [Candidatus Binatia bacterium]|nr:PqiC family protein [Candidatus Binatia bacterium]